MKIVQTALESVIDAGIPCVEGSMKDINPPKQYIVYSIEVTERSHADDMPTQYGTVCYINLWSKSDPTEVRNMVRTAMYGNGWALGEESSHSYNTPAYDKYTHQHCVVWEWVLFTDTMPE